MLISLIVVIISQRDYTFNHQVECETGILKEECENILKQFFKELRKMKNGG